jgi:hypothetical protein
MGLEKVIEKRAFKSHWKKKYAKTEKIITKVQLIKKSLEKCNKNAILRA